MIPTILFFLLKRYSRYQPAKAAKIQLLVTKTGRTVFTGSGHSFFFAKTANQGSVNAKFNYEWAYCDGSLAL